MPKSIEITNDQIPERLIWLTEVTIAGNELWRILALFLSLLFSLIVGRLLRFTLGRLATRLAPHQHLLAVAMKSLAKSCVYLLVVLGLKGGMQFLYLHPAVDAISDTVTTVLVATAVGYVAYTLVEVVDEWMRRISQSAASRMDEMLVPLVCSSLRATIVILVVVQIMTIVSEKPVTSVIAGLGIGGLAIGLAAQDTIKNVFGSVMIFGDRPFELGDEIIVDTFRGNIEKVGMRSTRFRTGDGYLITIPNGELANKTIVNVSRRQGLVRNLNLPLSYDMPPQMAERAVAIVQDILAGRPELDPRSPPRVFLSDLTAASMTLLVNYTVSPPDWWRYVAFNQSVNLEILRRFRAEEIRLAYPAQTIYLRSDAAPDFLRPDDAAQPADGTQPTDAPN